MKKVISILLVLCMLVSISSQSQEVKGAQDGGTSSYVFSGDGFHVRYEISSIWDKGYIANVYITNTGKETIENWELSYQSVDQYTNIWNAMVDYRSAKYYNIKNAWHNQNIKPGETVSFGFQARFHGKKPDIPDKYCLIGDHLIVSPKDCVPKFEVVNSWKNGCIMNVSLYNNSEKNIEDWALDCQFDYTIDNIWRATISDKNDNHYTFKNCEYNSVIRPGETETFGMQISFNEGTSFQNPCNVTMRQYRKDDFYMDFDKSWNNTMIRSDDVQVKKAIEKNKNTIKICMIDSGIDYSSNIKVKESINFVGSFPEKNPIFADLSGHGTAVAGILASNPTKNEDVYEFDNKYLKQLTSEKVNGVNPYVQLYSAEVLDDDNKTTVTQMIKGIEWAIKKKVNIINISCGLAKNSEKLHNAIKKAYNKGILIVAAAGAGKNIQYPAKYSEVMAVGAVKCDGRIMKTSPAGKEIEVVAPGEDVTTYGPFGILTNESGTSIAAPHVSALAAILWQQDKTKSADFIRELIKGTANTLGKSTKYGAGLIDCAYALEQYANFSKSYTKTRTNAEVYDNDNTLLLFDEGKVKGFWGKNEHINLARSGFNLLKQGAIWPDDKKSKVEGMTKHPEFHGYFKKDYISAYITITSVAAIMYNKGKYKKATNKFEKQIIKAAKRGIKEAGIDEQSKKQKEERSAFIYGMALHTAADIFAHSAAGVSGQDRRRLKNSFTVKALAKKWNTLKHGPKNKKTKKYIPTKNMADSTKCIPARFKKGAQVVCNGIINQAYNKKKTATKNVFIKVKNYLPLTDARSLKDKKQKKDYLT